MKITEDGFELSTGKTFYANNNILGIEPNGSVYEGYDGTLETNYSYEHRPLFTSEERKEIAEYVIAQWRKWARIEWP